jgi:hypothetical protein
MLGRTSLVPTLADTLVARTGELHSLDLALSERERILAAPRCA